MSIHKHPAFGQGDGTSQCLPGAMQQRREELDGGDLPGGSSYNVRVTTSEHAAIIDQ
jgi:hypothetical protein